MALTGKKKAFADAVLAGKSNKEAAIVAGYSKATAGPAGSRLVKDKEVAAYLSKARAAAEAGVEPEDDKPTFDLSTALQHQDPKMFLLAAMNDTMLAEKLRIDAAKALMPFVHKKLGEGGKKDQAAERAGQAAKRFGARPAPLKLVSGG
jgi:phage terminase small subunit